MLNKNEKNILKCIAKIRVKIGITLLANMLKGSKNTSTMRTEICNNIYFGIFNDHDLDTISGMINDTISNGYLEIYESDDKYTKTRPRLLRLTKKGKELIESERISINSDIKNSTKLIRTPFLEKDLLKQERSSI